MFLACDDEWNWTTGMEFSRRTGIPVERVLHQARLRGYFPEEYFMDLFRICTNVVKKYDIDRIPRADDDQ